MVRSIPPGRLRALRRIRRGGERVIDQPQQLICTPEILCLAAFNPFDDALPLAVLLIHHLYDESIRLCMRRLGHSFMVHSRPPALRYSK